jgi:hypothetical protein
MGPGLHRREPSTAVMRLSCGRPKAAPLCNCLVRDGPLIRNVQRPPLLVVKKGSFLITPRKKGVIPNYTSRRKKGVIPNYTSRS